MIEYKPIIWYQKANFPSKFLAYSWTMQTTQTNLMLEVHCIFIDDSFGDVVKPGSLYPIESFCLIWAEIERNFARGEIESEK